MTRTLRNGILLLATATLAACGTDAVIGDAGPSSVLSDAARPPTTGQTCKVADDCYPGLDGGFVKGETRCLDRVTGGYCTHTCQTDADCCAVPGECTGGRKHVCSPFESTGLNMCFLSCETADLGVGVDGGTLEASAYCQGYGAELSCRSSGGGSKNRKVCVP